jgi:hypothetical protein
LSRLDPAIHVFLDGDQDVDARHKAGPDEIEILISAAIAGGRVS